MTAARRFDLRWLIRALLVGLALVIYYAGDWHFAQVILHDDLLVLLPAFGVHVFGDTPDLVLRAGPYYFAITRNCVYLDLFLVLVPIVWRPSLRLGANAVRVALLSAAVAIGNLARLLCAVVITVAYGIDWQHSHHPPDVAIHLLVICGAVLFTLRADIDELFTSGNERGSWLLPHGWTNVTL